MGNFYVNAADTRISMTETRDVAAVATDVLTEPGHEGAQYDIMGPEALSYTDVAERLSAPMGREISYINVPEQATRDSLLSFGVDEWFAAALVGLYQDYRRSGTDGYAAQVTDTVEQITGEPARSLDQLLGEHELPAPR